MLNLILLLAGLGTGLFFMARGHKEPKPLPVDDKPTDQSKPMWIPSGNPAGGGGQSSKGSGGGSSSNSQPGNSANPANSTKPTMVAATELNAGNTRIKVDGREGYIALPRPLSVNSLVGTLEFTDTRTGVSYCRFRMNVQGLGIVSGIIGTATRNLKVFKS
jgi:hypothetical protein